jgi:hypothetical protein
MSRVRRLYHEREDATLSCPLIENLSATKVSNYKCRTFGASGIFSGCCVEMGSPKFERRTISSRDVNWWHCDFLQHAGSSRQLMKIVLAPNDHKLIIKIFATSRLFITGHENAALSILWGNCKTCDITVLCRTSHFLLLFVWPNSVTW